MSDRQVVVVASGRSPIGRAGKGSLIDVRPDDLLVEVASAVLGHLPDFAPSDLDEIYVGCDSPSGEQGGNLARLTAVGLGLDAVPAATVSKGCGSSMQTTRMGYHAILSGEADAVLSAGVECVSRYPQPASEITGHTALNPRYAEAAARSADHVVAELTGWEDPRVGGALPDPYLAMGQTAEHVARHCGISRERQDRFALRSHQRATSARERGHWDREIVPVAAGAGTAVRQDDCPRPDTSLEALARLRPVFRHDGTVTAGNSCPLNDGAAVLVLMSAGSARARGLRPLARILGTAVSALSPEIMGLGPVESTRRLLERTATSLSDFDVIEINEAFAAQVVASCDQLGIDDESVNPFGGSLALGHPFGMTGARLTVSLLNGLDAVDGTLGLQTLCIGGGQGMAIAFERL